MIDHEFEWGDGDDEFAENPLCNRCEWTLSKHTFEVLGITHEDETFEVDDSWKDRYSAINAGW